MTKCTMLPVLSRAYAECEALARSHYENFPVASWLLPRPMRPHVAALYAFARVADDIADEGEAPPEERRRDLPRGRTVSISRSRQRRRGACHRSGARQVDDRGDLILTAIAHSIRTLDLPLQLFDDLAQRVRSGYHDESVRLVGGRPRLLPPFGESGGTPRAAHRRLPRQALDRSSDALCTALQLTNFWQDFGRDWRAGRLYVPREVCTRSRRATKPISRRRDRASLGAARSNAASR